MKTIIIPTDFSSSADNAMHYGAQLAQQAGAEVLLVHVYAVPVTMNDMPVMVVSAEELKRTADEGLERCKAELQAAHPGLPVRLESRLGDVVSELKELCKQVQPLVVVMGTHGSKQFEQLLFGSNALSAIKHLHDPVITVPVNFQHKTLQDIVLAADYTNLKEEAKQQVRTLVQLFHSHLHVVHVQTDDEEEEAEPALLTELHDLTPVYRIIRDEDISRGLQNYISEVGAGLLIVLPHEHSFLESFFFKMHTKDLVTHAQVPVLCIRN